MNAPSFFLIFQQLRWRSLVNNLRVLRERSMLRAVTVLMCSLVVWGSLFVLSYMGLHEMRYKFRMPLDGPLQGFLLDMLFLSLTMLLIFSTGIILHSSLFSSPESMYLLSTPVPADHIFSYKLQGASAFSSWAFVLLGSPFLITYGMVVEDGASWAYYVSLILFFMGFVLIPGTMGAILTLIIVNILPKHKKQLLIALGLGALLILTMIGWRWVGALRGVPVGSRDWFTTILQELKPAQSYWMPSHWIARGLRAAALNDLERAGYYLALIWSNGLFWYTGTVWLSKWLYRRGYNRVASGGTLRKKYGGQWLDNCVGKVLFFLDPQTRLLVIKDVRTFRRDPAQWFQILIFLQLAILYFYNMRQYYSQEIGRSFQNGISLLTLMAIAFLMCAYTGRFIYPMLSLEGRKFWILGLLPLSRDRLLWGKFLFSAAGSLVVAEFLAIFSNIMLNMPWEIVCIHASTIAVLSCTLSGLSVGLGACMPNFRESDPSKIAVGLGGTLNLVACLLVLVVVIFLMAVPWHARLWQIQTASDQLAGSFSSWWLFPGMALGPAAGFFASFIAMRAGMHSLRKMEF